jgi:hypothetical protein
MPSTSYTEPHILDFRGFNPRRNLPWISSGKRGESNFVGAFERTFLSKQINGIGGRHFPLSGFGIADFLWISPRLDEESRKTKNEYVEATGSIENWCMTAFELKLFDWKQALLQAYRYSFFADQSIVVLPMEKIETAKKAIDSFQESRIGLWLFDKKSGLITKIYNPPNVIARSNNARSKAINFIQSKIKLSKFYKEFDPLVPRI